MKKIISVLALVLWCVAIIQGIDALSGEKETEVIQAFHSMSMAQENSKIQSYGKYNGDYLTVEEQKILLKTMAEALGIVDNYTLQENSDQYGRQLTLFLDGTQADTKIEFITQETEEESHSMEVNQYLKTEVQIENSIESAFYYKNTVDMLMSRYAETPQTVIHINGEYQGNLDTEQKDALSVQLLEQLKAEVVVEHREDTYVVYAYTPMIEEYKKVGKDKINLTIAIVYNEESDTTEVLLATPLLNEDF